MKKKILAMLLCSCLLTMSSCGGDQPDETKPDSVQETETETELSEEELLYRNLPTGDFGGYECHFAQFVFDHLANMSKYQVTVDETSGEIVNDALYDVSRRVEEKLNTILITDVYNNRNTLADHMKSTIQAGDHVCDAFFSLDANSFFLDGSLINLSDISALQFENLWWNQDAIQSVQVTEDIYFGYGNISLQQFANRVIILFNKQIAEDNGMENFYDLVRNNGWTLDLMLSYGETAARDVNGDGQHKATDDIYALSGGKSGMLGLLYGCGADLFTRTEEGNIAFTSMNEAFYNAFDKLTTVFGDSNLFYYPWTADGISQYHMLKTNQTLYSIQMVQEMEELRDMETDYGVLPYPKWNTAQEDYISFIYTDCAPLTIPVTVQDTERTGVILENLCAETYLNVTNVYLEDMLEQKLLRDRDSIEMMQMILNSRSIISPCQLYNWGGIMSAIQDGLQKPSVNITTRMEEIHTKVESEIASYIECAESYPN